MGHRSRLDRYACALQHSIAKVWLLTHAKQASECASKHTGALLCEATVKIDQHGGDGPGAVQERHAEGGEPVHEGERVPLPASVPLQTPVVGSVSEAIIEQINGTAQMRLSCMPVLT